MVTGYPAFFSTAAYMSASISFSEKLAEETVILGLALVVAVALSLELPPDPQAPATRASTATIAPTAPPRLHRIGSVPLLSICDQEGPGHHQPTSGAAAAPGRTEDLRSPRRGSRMPAGVKARWANPSP